MDINHDGPSIGYKQELKRALGFKSLLLFGFAYIGPTAVMTYVGLISMSTHGMLALTFAVATVAMAFTAFSYAKMVTVYPIAGSSYSYTSKTINPYIGFMTGWVILLDYVFLPVVSYLLVGLYANLLIPEVPGWIFIAITAIFVMFIQYKGIDILARFNNVLILIETIFMIAVLLFMVKFIVSGNGTATLFSPTAIFNPAEFGEIGIGTIFSGASILVLCFLGIDAATTLAEEAIEPEKNVGKAIIVVTIGVGIYFTVYAYIMQCAWPTGWMEFETADTASAEIVEVTCGSVIAYLFTAIYLLSCLTCVMAISTSGTRILYSMGRDGIFPKRFFGYVSPKTKTPVKNILFVGIGTAVTACLVDLLSISSIVNFGALIAFTMVNLSVIAHFYVREKRRGFKNVMKYLVSPAIGALICIVVFINLDKMALIIGGSWTVIGIIYMAVMTKGFKQLPKEMSLSEE